MGEVESGVFRTRLALPKLLFLVVNLAPVSSPAVAAEEPPKSETRDRVSGVDIYERMPERKRSVS